MGDLFPVCDVAQSMRKSWTHASESLSPKLAVVIGQTMSFVIAVGESRMRTNGESFVALSTRIMVKDRDLSSPLCGATPCQ